MNTKILSNDLINQYFLMKNKDSEENHPNEEIYKEHFKNKSSEEIKTFLIENEDGETGGITALSGFYYQFLVTIEYVIELLEDKWDFLIMEHRDDVVVGNKQCIRFIQVKSSKKNSCIATDKPASDLYKRKLDDGKLIANSWVDKLLMNSKKFYKDNGIRTEFQLYSSYQILRSSREMNVDIYSDNLKYNIEASLEKDMLFKKLNVEIYNSDKLKTTYEEQCGESLEDLLKRFYVWSGNKFFEIDKFERYLCHKLGAVILENYAENITISKSGLKYLIGELFENCTQSNEVDSLVITKDSISMIIEKLITDSLNSADQSMESHNAIRMIQQVTDKWIKLCGELKESKEVKTYLLEYNNYFQSWISNDGISFKHFIERLHGSLRYSNVYSTLINDDKEKIITDISTLVLAFKLVKNENLEFNSNKTMIIKKSHKEDELRGLIRMEKKISKNEAIKKLIEILKVMSLGEELKILHNKNISIAFFNCLSRGFEKTEIIELLSQDLNQIVDFDDTLTSFIQVNPRVNVYRGDVAEYLLESLQDENVNTLDELQRFLQNIMDELELYL